MAPSLDIEAGEPKSQERHIGSPRLSDFSSVFSRRKMTQQRWTRVLIVMAALTAGYIFLFSTRVETTIVSIKPMDGQASLGHGDRPQLDELPGIPAGTHELPKDIWPSFTEIPGPEETGEAEESHEEEAADTKPNKGKAHGKDSKTGESNSSNDEEAEDAPAQNTSEVPDEEGQQRPESSDTKQYWDESEPETPTEDEESSATKSEPTTTSFNPAPYITSFMNLKDETFERMTCDDIDSKRYGYLQMRSDEEKPKIKYFFSLLLYEAVPIMPSLMGALINVLEFLGPKHCALSIVEGRSKDGTDQLLKALAPVLEEMGVRYTLGHSSLNPKGEGVDQVKRVVRLSALRNQALEPLTTAMSSDFEDDAMVIFPNDVSTCPEDFMELIHQHRLQKADQTCAMDWNMGGKIFYDVWVARDMYGEPFFHVLPDYDWGKSERIFPYNKETKTRWEQRQPFQVFACWNGITTFNAKMFMDDTIRFRGKRGGECETGEPTYLAKDMWNAGFKKIVVVPTVNVAYANWETVEAKKNYGTVRDGLKIAAKGPEKEMVKWLQKPQRMVCAPNHDPRWWVSTDTFL